MNIKIIKKITYITLTLILLSICEMSFADNDKIIVSKPLPSPPDKRLSTTTISYPADPSSDYTDWEKYFSELLALALSKVKTPYHLSSVPIKTRSTTRAERLLTDNIVTVNWIHTSRQREQSLLPIRIPLFKGLIGWRIFLIHQSNARLFESVVTLDQLKKLNALQGVDWPDTIVLNNNGFNLQTSRHTENLLRMLQFKRADYFPRSVVEIWREINSFPNKDLMVEESLVIRYPTAYYYFVSKKNPEVKAAIEQGLNTAISDGSFDQLFMKYFGEAIKRSNLHNRKIFHIKNPLLSKETPFSRSELWYSPAKK